MKGKRSTNLFRYVLGIEKKKVRIKIKIQGIIKSVGFEKKGSNCLDQHFLKNARIAIVHEWWALHGGSENVANRIASLFPEAKVFCLYIDDEAKESEFKFKIKESWVRNLPLHRNRSIAAALSLLAFRSLSFRKFDIVITSSHTFAHTTKFLNSRKALYLSYVHTPARTLWLPELDSRSKLLKVKAINAGIRKFDTYANKHVYAHAANSNEVAGRIQKFWKRDSKVIHPPVSLMGRCSDFELLKKSPYVKSKKYLISAGRFVEYKRHDFAIQLASTTNLPIVIMGAGPEEGNLRARAEDLGVKCEFVISPDTGTWNSFLQNAKCMIFPSFEDFGITPVEALSLGTPVVALNSGGSKDYIVDGVNGYLVNGLDVAEFTKAIHSIASLDPEEIASSSKQFSEEKFDSNFYDWVESSAQEFFGREK